MLLLVEFAVQHAEHISEIGAGSIGSDAPGEGDFVVLLAIQIPVLNRAGETLTG